MVIQVLRDAQPDHVPILFSGLVAAEGHVHGAFGDRHRDCRGFRWDLDTSIVIRDWMGERVYIKQLNLNQYPCVTALYPCLVRFLGAPPLDTAVCMQLKKWMQALVLRHSKQCIVSLNYLVLQEKGANSVDSVKGT